MNRCYPIQDDNYIVSSSNKLYKTMKFGDGEMAQQFRTLTVLGRGSGFQTAPTEQLTTT